LFLSGQSNRNETIRNSNLALRQFGVQEADIVGIVNTITKYTVMVNDPDQIRYHLEKAVYLAKTGRKGPVWLDIPLDVQSAVIDEKNLFAFDPNELEYEYSNIPLKAEMLFVEQVLAGATRPIVLAGQGVRLSGGITSFKTFIEKFNIPYVASRLGIDLLPSDHPLFIGRIGTKGDEAGNFAIQNADVILSIGSRLSISSTGFDYDAFGKYAKLIVVDIDPIEHKKNTVNISYFINSDARVFLDEVLSYNIPIVSGEWVKLLSDYKKACPVAFYGKDVEQGINTYTFVNKLSKELKNDSVVISDAGSAFFVVGQGLQLKENQRWVTSGAQAEMGYTIPATVGVSLAKHGEVIGITGDGSFQMNIQELQTIVYHKLPVKLFVWNNNGYASIRDTQDRFFNNHYIGTDMDCGVSFPDLSKIADAYGIRYFKIDKYSTMNNIIKRVLSLDEPVICEVICDKNQKLLRF